MVLKGQCNIYELPLDSLKKMKEYHTITDKDIGKIMGMPAVCNQPCIDIYCTLREKLGDVSLLTYITAVYKWGYLQGKRNVTDWHGQTASARKKEAARSKN